MATNDSGSSTRKKSTSTKSTPKKSTGQKSTGKDTAGKASPERSTTRERPSRTSRASAPRAESRPTPSATELARSAARELLELTGKQPEGITGLERTDDGWTVQVEVVEVRRIPDTTDVLAVYEIATDEHGRLQGYRRIKRYARGVPGEE